MQPTLRHSEPRVRPAPRRPASTSGSVRAATNAPVLNGWITMPSATLAIVSVIRGPNAPTQIGGGRTSPRPAGTNSGVIKSTR